MSASDPNSAIYVTDSAKDIKNKVGIEVLFHVMLLIPYFSHRMDESFGHVCSLPMLRPIKFITELKCREKIDKCSHSLSHLLPYVWQLQHVVTYTFIVILFMFSKTISFSNLTFPAIELTLEGMITIA